MSDSVYYHQNCPVCGRMLRIGVRLLGRRVYCQHCGGGFRASDPALEAVGQTETSATQADRVEQLLALSGSPLAERLGGGGAYTASGQPDSYSRMGDPLFPLPDEHDRENLGLSAGS